MVGLHVHSYYSLLRGVDRPETLARRAAELGYRALALTDRDALYGAIRFNLACREVGIAAIFGAEVTLDAAFHVTLLAADRAGYANLTRLLSISRLAHEKGVASTSFEVLAAHADGLFCLSGPRSGPIPTLLLQGKRSAALAVARRYRDVFGQRFFLELQDHALPDDASLNAELAALGRHLGISLVATMDVHYAHPDGQMVQDVLTAIRTRTTLAHPSPERLPNGEYDLKGPDAFAARFHRYPEALANSDRIAASCQVDLDFRDARFPTLALPDGATPDAHLRTLAYQGARERYGTVSERVIAQLDKELDVTARRGMAPFFLIAADLARRFRGRCRGSAAGSVVVYCLGMSAVDPLAHDMLFERFINPDRDSVPDIDLDFSVAERENAIGYCYQTYGADSTGMVANYVRFRARSAIRDVGRVLGMPSHLIDRLAKSVDGRADVAEEIARIAARTPGAPTAGSLLTRFCSALDDVPRHLSVHAGGMLLTGRPLVECFALEPARKPGIVVIGGDKEDVEDSGLAKLDLLCLRSLSVVQECEELLRARGVTLDVARLPLDDPRVYAALQHSDTIGASQVESRAQMQSLARTRPTTFNDLVIQVAIIRPGPIIGGMVHSYYRRRTGQEPVRYLHPALKPILESTLGIFLYQEQVLLGVSALTGCSAGEADQFRRAMGSHRSHEAMARLRPWFLERAIARGIAPRIATAAFDQIAGFASYGFCRSHAAALARLAYETTYLKLYHPQAFAAALLNNQPMGFYPPGVIYWDARRHGVQFLPVDMNASAGGCTLEGDPPVVRLGLGRVHRVGSDAAAHIVAERAVRGPYLSLTDFTRRTGLTGPPVESLVLAGAFTFERRSREEQLWQIYGQAGNESQAALELTEEAPDLPPRSEAEQVLLDYAVLGFCLDRHLVELYRGRLTALRVTPSDRLGRVQDGAEVRVGGLVVCRQRPPAAKGFVFLTLEDERGLVNVIVRPDVYDRYRDVLRNHPLVAVAGRVQKAYGMVNVLATRALAIELRPVPSTESSPVAAGIRSHDFR